MQKLAKLLLFSACTAGVALVNVSCDSAAPTTEADRIDAAFELTDRGIDMAAATANPGGLADMPKFLLPGDTIAHNPTGAVVNMQPPGHPSFPVTGEDRAATDHLPVREVSPLGTMTITSTGEIQTDNIHLIYAQDRGQTNLGSWEIAPINRWPQLDETRNDQYTERMDQIIAGASGTSNSVNAALGREYDSQTPIIMTDAARSIGYLTAVGPERFEELQTAEVPYVLMDRIIRYRVTSNNSQLITNGIITGTYTITDTWGTPRLLAVEVEGTTFDDNTFDQIELVHTTPPFTLARTVDITTGTFTLTFTP